MIPLAPGLSYIDLEFQHVSRVIATVVIHSGSEAALIDPGPSSALPQLRRTLAAAGLRVADLRAILLTHIHLDHAGAAGTLIAENPQLELYVHAVGAPHMSRPERLLASAARLYGDQMDALWGEFLPVPPDRIRVLTGGERLTVGDRELDVMYTPGHASHHVSYFNRASGVAFVGDTAGIRIPPEDAVLPPTPPPDIDLEAWRTSLANIAAWRPDTLFLTHFGAVTRVSAHVAELGDRLDAVAALAKRSLERDGSDQEREAWFIGEIRRELRQMMSEADAQAAELAGRFDLSWRGLARYWRKRA